jgi:hypothetical protein
MSVVTFWRAAFTRQLIIIALRNKDFLAADRGIRRHAQHAKRLC